MYERQSGHAQNLHEYPDRRSYIDEYQTKIIKSMNNVFIRSLLICTDVFLTFSPHCGLVAAFVRQFASIHPRIYLFRLE